jgi:hypothetical protein
MSAVLLIGTDNEPAHRIAVDGCVAESDNRRIVRSTDMSEHLTKLMEAARGRAMSGEEKEAQRRSFAYGNAHIENERVTREMVAAAAEKIGKID